MRSIRPALTVLLGGTLAAMLGTSVFGQSPTAPFVNDGSRNFDGRLLVNQGLQAGPSESHVVAVETLRHALPELAVTYDDRLGVARTLYNRAGYLTAAAPGDPVQVALGFVRANETLLGLGVGEVAASEVTDIVRNPVTGSTHLYLRQTFQGLSVYNAQLQVNVNRDGRILSVNNQFVPGLVGSVNAVVPSLGASEAVSRAAVYLGSPLAAPLAVVDEGSGIDRATELDSAGVSLEPIRARLMLLPIRLGTVRLVWNFQLYTTDSEHAHDLNVDTETGAVWTRFDWVTSDSYQVYQQPVESPIHTTPGPPADGRTTQTNPANATASPFGWHDTNGVVGAEFTTMRGNNAHAYEDRNNSGTAPGTEPDCGSTLNCLFPIDLTQAPSQYTPAAVANLFYWNNIIHDVQYQYGYTETGGNFQVNNLGRGGLGNDDVRAEVQDGADIGNRNNANMLTPPDGSRPRMQMFLWDLTNPERDGDFDNGIVIHEYGHGISIRQVGGPANSGCLNNNQQPGEGLSDWWSLTYTARMDDVGTTGRGVGTYALGQAPTGAGIRPQLYSTDPAINTWTYESINGMAIPHGVGAVWAQAAWEMYWALVGAHGFDPNLYNGTGTAGNQRAMLYVNEGLQNTVCSPTFTDVRDGILQAAADNHGGQDVCVLWGAFAGFGLGADAVSGGPGNTSPTNGFTLPAVCQANAPHMGITDATVTEGNAAGPATFTTLLDQASTNTVTVDFATADGTATSAQLANTTPIDIPAAGTSGPAGLYPATITVPAGAPTPTHVSVTLTDFSHTWPADLDVVLVGPRGESTMLMSDVGGSTDAVNAELTFDDSGPPLASPITSGTYQPTNLVGAGDVLPAPAPAGPYGATLGVFTGVDPSGMWSLYVNDQFFGDTGSIAGGWTLTLTPAIGGDYIAASGTLTFPPGTTTQTVSVNVVGDTTDEPDETFVVNLTNAVNAILDDSQAVGTILNDDGQAPEIAITDATVTEGTAVGPALFTASLSTPSSSTVTVAFATADGTATSADYVSTSGTLTFPPGTTTQTVRVDIIADTTQEPDETFVVNLTNAVNATIADAQAVGTIVNDDPAPEIAITDATVTEGTAAGPALFTASLSTPSSSTVTVAFATADGTATSADYVGASGTLPFLPGTTSQTVSVDIIADTTREPDETFVVNLTNAVNATIADAQAVGTIVNDDPTPEIAITDATVTEGTAAGPAVFTASLSTPSSSTVTVAFATADGTATSADYVGTLGTLTFLPGTTSQTVSVDIIADTTQEPDETFVVNLTNAVNATIADAQAVGTIVNDDGGAPEIAITDATVTEGTAAGPAVFAVSLSTPSVSTVTVAFATADGTATSALLTKTTPIDIPATISGPVGPYPSTITVPAGVPTPTHVSVTLTDFKQPWPADLDVVLVGPGGQSTMLMSKVGGSTDAVNAELTFADGGPPLTTPITSGTYQPTNIGGAGEVLPAPAPAGPYGTTFAVFTGVDPSGTWSLYVNDHFGGDTVSITGGWTLTLTPALGGDYIATSGTLTFLPGTTSQTVRSRQ